MDDELFEDIDTCEIHGDDYQRECNICGRHFCQRCVPRSLVCDNRADEEDPDDLDLDEEFSELSEYEDLLDNDDDDEIDRLIEESNLLPPEDIDDEDLEEEEEEREIDL